MNLTLVRLTKNISFEMIANGKITPTEVYKSQVTSWIFNPARVLIKEYNRTNNTDLGMGILIILLTFFEPHAQYMRGDDSNRKSGDFFKTAFDDFILFSGLNCPISADDFYSYVRCGLFHSSIIKNKILIDSVGCTDKPIAANTTPHFKDSVLVNPTLLEPLMSKYLDAYLGKINLNPNSEMATNFLKTYDRLITDSIETFRNLGKNK